MEPKFWHERWQSGEIGFHQAAGNAMLANHWPALDLPAGGDVLVPLCGKSLDMVWLAEEGHRVIGVELSPLAVDAFFDERGLDPEVEETDGFRVSKAGPFEIWCGDLFALPAEATDRVEAIYDRAALVALPRELRPRYADKLAAIAAPGTPMLLVSLAFDAAAIPGPPFPVPLAEVVDLFGQTFTIALKETGDGLEQSRNLRERGLRWLEESAYLLTRKRESGRP